MTRRATVLPWMPLCSRVSYPRVPRRTASFSSRRHAVKRGGSRLLLLLPLLPGVQHFARLAAVVGADDTVLGHAVMKRAALVTCCGKQWERDDSLLGGLRGEGPSSDFR